MRIYILFIFFCTLVCQAQFQINGIIRAQDSRVALPFVTITDNTGQETLSDIDGRFVIESKSPLIALKISYLGYTAREIFVDTSKKFYEIELSPKIDLIEKVQRLSDQKGLEIIKKVIDKKSQNDPEKKLQNFEFKAYN
ncbi:MAG: carboxypeptidase-like regulatory domain-containing protein, partial [Bacteroidota bacterium]